MELLWRHSQQRATLQALWSHYGAVVHGATMEPLWAHYAELAKKKACGLQVGPLDEAHYEATLGATSS